MILNLERDNFTFEISDYSESFPAPGYVGIYVIQLNKIGNPQIIKIFTTEEEGLFEETFEFPQDGHYTVAKIMMPNKESFQPIIGGDYKTYFYADTEEIDPTYGIYKIYKVSYDDQGNRTDEVIELPDLIDINCGEGTTVKLYKELIQYFSICYLYKCYVNLCKRLFKDLFGPTKNGRMKPCSCGEKVDLDVNLKYKRDLVQSTLSVIQYLVDCNRLEEAQRILERIGSCNGICPTANDNISKSRCGCQS